MVALPDPTARTLSALDAAMEAAQDNTPRAYLGLSQIGAACERALWYGFRWAAQRKMPASALRAIADGHAGEDVMATRLRMVPGVELHTADPSTGQQFGLETLAGHVRGHMDGAINGVLEAPKTWHVWEHKQVNLDKFKKLQKLIAEHGEKATLAKWDAVYFGQAICYMGLSGMTRHFLTVGSPGGRDYVTVRTEFDQAALDRFMDRARRVIEAAEPPARISDDPAWHECKWCTFYSVCHQKAAPELNCRTCAHSTPDLSGTGGTWRCESHRRVIPIATQRKGCERHLFVPPLLQAIGDPVDGDTDRVVYRTAAGPTLTNGPAPGFSSAEILASWEAPWMLVDPQVQQIKQTVSTARVTAVKRLEDMPNDL